MSLGDQLDDHLEQLAITRDARESEKPLLDEIKRLEREVAELRADAQRYRALCRLDDWTYCEGYTPEELNAFLDKLYAEQSAQGGV